MANSTWFVGEAPEQSYYPAAKMRLILRFEEFGRNSMLQKRAPTKGTKTIDGVGGARDPLVATRATGADGITRFTIGAPNLGPATAPHSQARSSDGLTFDVTLVPKSADWNQNGLRTADTLSVDFKYIDCPVDPRVVRSAAIEYYLGCWRPEDFAANILGAGRYGASDGAKRPAPMIPDGQDGNSFLRFQGWVDKWSVDWEDGQEPLVHLECADNTRLMIGQEASMKHVLDMSKPLDEAIARYLASFPSMYGLTVTYFPNNEAPPVLKNVLQNTAFRPALGPQPSKSGGSTANRLSVWDYLTDVCGSIGHAIQVDGTSIIVQRVRSFTSGAIVRRPNDPFQGRTVAGERFEFRRFIYGRNVKSMRVARNFTQATPTNIEVRSYSGGDKKLLVARFPLPEDRLAYALPGNAQPDQKWMVFKVSGIKDQKMLRVAAQTIYESLGRRELSVEVKTNNLASFGGGNADPDLLDMKPGDTIELLVNRDADEVNTLTNIERQLTSQALNAEFFRALGFGDDFASAYAKAYTDAGFLTTFRVRSTKHTWSLDQGVEINVQGVNYIEVRADKNLPAGEEPGGTAPRPQRNDRTVGP